MPNTVSQFAARYPGVEGFYFLSKNGELGYIKPGEGRSVKETFPRAHDSGFIDKHPTMPAEIESFRADMAALAAGFDRGELGHAELGHVVPYDKQQSWKSCTVIIANHVIETLREDEKMLYTRGLKDIFKAEAESQKFHPRRSIQRGLEDLMDHRDAFGAPRYFPGLFLTTRVPVDRPEPSARLRVVNLRWRRTEGSGDHPPNVGHIGAREDLFAVMRESLIDRGALDPAQRLENRLGLE